MSLKETFDNFKVPIALSCAAVAIGYLSFSDSFHTSEVAKEKQPQRRPASVKDFKDLKKQKKAAKEKVAAKEFVSLDKFVPKKGTPNISRTQNLDGGNFREPSSNYNGSYSAVDTPNKLDLTTSSETSIDDTSQSTTGTSQTQTGELSTVCQSETCFNSPTAQRPPRKELPPKVQTDSGPLSVTADLHSGIYVKNPLVSLTGVNINEIRYCLSPNQTCCAPTQKYVSKIEVTSNPGVYDGGSFCLSFQGVGNLTSTAVIENLYVVDNTVPALSSVFYPDPNLKRIQTYENHNYVRSTSSDFGADGFFYYTLNTEGVNPNTYADCEEIVKYHNPDYQGLRAPAGQRVLEATEYNAPGPVDLKVSAHNELTHYGTNYLVSVMEHQDFAGNSIFSCITNEVVLEDFFLFQHSSIEPYQALEDSDGIAQFQGMILDYGPFGGGVSGQGIAAGPQYNLESQFVNIIN